MILKRYFITLCLICLSGLSGLYYGVQNQTIVYVTDTLIEHDTTIIIQIDTVEIADLIHDYPESQAEEGQAAALADWDRMLSEFETE